MCVPLCSICEDYYRIIPNPEAGKTTESQWKPIITKKGKYGCNKGNKNSAGPLPLPTQCLNTCAKSAGNIQTNRQDITKSTLNFQEGHVLNYLLHYHSYTHARPLHLSESYCWDQTFCRRPKPPPHAFVPATAVGAWPKCSPIAVRLILSDWPTAHRIRMRLCAFVYGPWPLKLLFMLLKFFQLCLSFCLGEKESHLPGRG